METDETNENWRSDLTNWKSMRKSQSSYQRVQELEPTDEVPRKQRAKTYREMMEERQRRKTANEHCSTDSFDVDDDDWEFGSSTARMTSNDDLSQDGPPDVFLKSSSSPRSLQDAENVGQNLHSGAEKANEIEKETTLLTSAEPPSASDNQLKKSSEPIAYNQQKVKVDTNHDLSSFRDPKKSSNFSSNRDKFEIGPTVNPAGKSVGEVKSRLNSGSNFTDKLKMWNKPGEAATQQPHGQKNSFNQKMPSLATGKENAVQKNSANMFSEKIIRINQGPNLEKGFGFTISGGREHNGPIVVDKVVRGGSADICELKAGDEIIAINGADVARHYSESVQNVLAQSVATGTIELKVKRLKDLEDDFEEEVFSDEELRPAVEKRGQKFSGSQSSQWSSPPSTPPALPSAADALEFLTDDLPPPPLPSVPPPPPNWNTFPGEVCLSSAEATSEATPVGSRDEPFAFGYVTDPEKTSRFDQVDHSSDVPERTREDILKKKSQFFGLKLEDSQEFKTLKEDQEKKSKAEGISKTELTLPAPPPPSNHLPNNKSSFGSLYNTGGDASSGNFSVPAVEGNGRLEWSNSKRLEIDSRLVVAAEEDARSREEREEKKLKEKEEQLKLMEKKLQQEAERLEQEKQRIARETEEQFIREREKLRQETERQLKQERERLLRDKEEQLRQDQERIQREKEEMLRRQNEEQLRWEKERLEKNMEERLRLERERLMREKDEMLKREKEQLQREQELQKERLQREKEEKLRLQNAEQLRREKERLEKETEEQLRLERERLMHENEEMLKREKERLQRELELQKKELQEQFHMEQKQPRMEQLEQQKQLNLTPSNESLNKGVGLGYSSQANARKPSSEPSDSDVANYSTRYGGKTFARLAAQARSDSLEPTGSNLLAKGEAFSKLSFHDEDGSSQEFLRPVGKKLDKADISTNFSSIRSNFESAKTSSVPLKEKLSEPAPWKRGSRLHHDVDTTGQLLDDKRQDEQKAAGSAEFSRGSSLVPLHSRSASLGTQIGTEKTATAGPQIREQTSSREPSFEPQFRGSTVSLGPHLESQVGEQTTFLGPRVGERTTSLVPQTGERTTSLGPQIGERTTSLGLQVGEHTTSFGLATGGKASQEKQEVLQTGNQYMPSARPWTEEPKMPLVGERTASLGPQFRGNDALPGPHIGERRTLAERQFREPQTSLEQFREPLTSLGAQVDQTIRRPAAGEPTDQSMMTPQSNISYLLYGGEEKTYRQSAVPGGARPDGARTGGYNSLAVDYDKTSETGVPPADKSRKSASDDHRGLGFPSYHPASSALPVRQLNESSLSNNSSTVPYSKKHDNPAADAKYVKPVGPKPFEAPLKYQTGLADHWLVEEAERRRVAEQTGQERSWNLGQDHPRNFQRTGELISNAPPEHSLDSAGVWAAISLYTNRPNVVETPSLRSPRSVPEPVKQTLLNRINTGTSARSPTPLGPLPSYPKDYSHGPASHSRSVSNPVTDSHPFPSAVRSTVPPPSGSSSNMSSGGAVDSLFAYHQQIAQPETNLTSQASLSHSQGSLHLDGTPQYASVSQGIYPRPANAPQTYSATGNVPNVLAKGGETYRIYTTKEPGYSFGRDVGSFPSYCQPVVTNLLCTNCQRPLTEINGKVLLKDGDMKLHCQNCYQENEVKYSKV